MNPLHEIREAENLLLAFEHPTQLGEAYTAVGALVEAAWATRRLACEDHQGGITAPCAGCRAVARLDAALAPFLPPTVQIQA
jgi:hypothetical protein